MFARLRAVLILGFALILCAASAWPQDDRSGTIQIPLALVDQISAHLASLLSSPQRLTEASLSQLQTAAYWQQTLQLNPTLAGAVAQIIQINNAAIQSRKMTDSGQSRFTIYPFLEITFY